MSEKLLRHGEENAGKPWYREAPVLVLIGLVAAAYFVRIGAVSMRGEEPTRAQVAFEILRSGDWIVPRVQGEVFRSRPPLQNWLIAGSTVVCGTRDAWAVRLPSVLAMLLTTLLIYGYSRTCLSRIGALAAAAAFPTFGEMFTTGGQAETDMVFTALVSASLILWHWGQVSGWPELRTWVAGYVFVALAVLCKGPQPPVYFVGSVGVYLLLTGQWRRLFTVAHLTGILVGVAVGLAWLIPCVLQTSWPQARAIVMNDTASRFLSWTALEVGTHLVQFPLEVLGCTLPWSLLLLGWASRDLRRSLGDARPQSLFMAISVGIAFLSIWIPPDGQTRYFTPLYPCMAVLIGLVVEGCIRADAPSLGRDAWRRFSLFQAGVMVTLGLVVVFAACCLPNHPKYAPWAEPVFVAIGYAAASVVLAVVTLRGRHGGDAVRIRNTVLAIACFMVLTFTGVVTDIRVRRSEDQASAVARLKEQLPPGQRLVSFGGIDQLFAYYYAVPIDRLPLPGKGPGLDSEHDFFCFQSFSGSRPTLPFAWREVAAISMDRHASATPESMVVVGRRVPAAIAAAPSPAERSKPGR